MQWLQCFLCAEGRRYPWGEAWDASKANGEMAVGGTTPVGTYAAGVGPYGIHDMVGNVGEWVADWFESGYYRRSPERNPRGPDTGRSDATLLRVAFRNDGPLETRANTVGFRRARDAAP